MWQSTREISQILEEVEMRETLDQLFALSVFWDNAVYPDNYRAEGVWPDLLIPTQYGETCLGSLRQIQSNTPQPEFYLALFTKFFHHQVLFDWQQSDLDGIADLLERELLEERIRLPHRFGRLLYDRFNDLMPEARTDHILPDEVAELLQGTPQGVYQQSTLLCGPLGVLASQEVRRLPLSLRLPLWHCSDTGCGKVHTVFLKPPPIPLTRAKKSISDFLEGEQGPPSEWYSELAWLHRYPDRSASRKYIDLPLVIAECIVGSERVALVEMALKDSQGDYLRAVLSQSSKGEKSSAGPAREVAERLTPAEQLQLLLSLPDPELIRLVDKAVYLQAVNVGPGSIRRAKQRPPTMVYGDALSELSALGIRSAKGNPIINLVSCDLACLQ